MSAKIVEAAAKGDLGEVTRLLDPKPDQKDLDLALSVAAPAGHEAIARQLLKAGAATSGKRAASALCLAAQNGQAPVVRALLEAGCKPGLRESFTGFSPLHFAAEHNRVDVIQTLVEKKARVDIRNPDGETPLMRAALNGHLAAVEALLRAGADPTLQARDKSSALDNARSRGHLEIVKSLESSQD
jgi:ankyrin repeat protein